MSEINKLDNKQCPFDPDQYKYSKKIDVEVDNVAPVGSFPWAMIQVYLGDNVRRNVWDANTYIYGDNIGTDDQAVKQRNKEGTFAWNPEQQDMLACDWTKMDCMLSFDLVVGTSKTELGEQNWGYLADEEWASIGENPFGDLTNFQNKTDIKEFSLFIWWSDILELDIRVSSGMTQDGYQKMKALFGKNLTVTSNGVSYSLGQAAEGDKGGQKQYEFVGLYTNTDAKQLGDLLKQNVDNTLHFCFNWK